jgi:1,4-alpha-glucan branching enzyme
MKKTNVVPHSLFSDFDIALFQSGKHFRLYEKMGSHCLNLDGIAGTYFAFWAPNAQAVALKGSFSDWKSSSYALFPRIDGSGIWEGFVPGVAHGDAYKYSVTTPQGKTLDKGDPYALRWETPPGTASLVWDNWYEWKDQDWMQKRKDTAAQPKPWSVYEVHLGSWKKLAEDGNRSLNYRELAVDLVQYVVEMGFTHIEFMPIMEHPYYPSWGYQITGYFATSSRFGSPQDFMYLVDALHAAGIGVILDWVPSHFPSDIHGLYLIDGTHVYNYADMRKGFHPDWNSYVFDYGRNEVRSFLISNALFWLDRFHADALRVDAVASMLYLDYSRNEGQWLPNVHGGRENLEAISLLKEFNETVYSNYPGVETIAEESTSYPGVSRPIWEGGLGFGQKWMMGWMHDALTYFERPSMFRRWHQNEVTFSFSYAFSERFMLPLSHDEVVHLKSSLLYKMPGNEWEKFANLRSLFGLQWMHPGSHLLFMGGEIGQSTEWSHDAGVIWPLAQYPLHAGVQSWVRDLNHFYKAEAALWHYGFDYQGFEWVSGDDTTNSVVTFLRRGTPEMQTVLVICHFGPSTIEHYRIGVPFEGSWREVLNSDNEKYGGKGIVNGTIKTTVEGCHNRPQSIEITIAPLAVQVFVAQPQKAKNIGKSKVPKAKAQASK